MRRIRPIDILMVGVFPLIIAVALVVGTIASNRATAVQLRTSCLSAKANVDQLAALASIARDLGLPIRFEIPILPEECGEFLPEGSTP